MAGDWIPISVTLPSNPKVIRIAGKLNTDPDRVVGLLVRFWSWAQSHTADGTIPGLDLDGLTMATAIERSFFEALQMVGWLVVQEGGILIPEFDVWFSGAAKRRLYQSRWRSMERKNRAPLSRPAREIQSRRTGDKMSTSNVDKLSTQARDSGDKMSTSNVDKLSPSEGHSVDKVSTTTVDNLSPIGEDRIGENRIGEDRIGKDRTGKKRKREREDASLFEPHSTLESTSLGNVDVGAEVNCSESASCGSLPAPPPEITELRFPCIGGAWRITDQLYITLKESYPTLDVDRELRKVYAWLMVNPRRRKKAGNMPRFLVSWFNRALERDPPDSPEDSEDIYA